DRFDRSSSLINAGCRITAGGVLTVDHDTECISAEAVDSGARPGTGDSGREDNKRHLVANGTDGTCTAAKVKGKAIDPVAGDVHTALGVFGSQQRRLGAHRHRIGYGAD